MIISTTHLIHWTNLTRSSGSFGLQSVVRWIVGRLRLCLVFQRIKVASETAPNGDIMPLSSTLTDICLLENQKLDLYDASIQCYR